MHEKIIYTICTANHLAMAKSLGDSLIQTNPDYKLYIGLLDKIEGRFDPDYFLPHKIIETGTLNIPAFEEMRGRYSLFELSCALKPWFALHFFNRFSLQQVIYLDTDIKIFSSLRYLEEQLNKSTVLLTPHLLSPLPTDNKRPLEKTILNSGIYNAGFFGVKNNETGIRFLNWWKDILIKYCYDNGRQGLFVDQIWLNFVPIFFPGTAIIDHRGCNVAYWNLHERMLSKKEGSYLVNNEFPLLFFHFSGYSFKQPEKLSRHQDRFSIMDNPVLQELFQQYREGVINNRHQEMQQLSSVFAKPKSFFQRLGLKK